MNNGYNAILNLLERVLGTAQFSKNNETAFFCPRCNHHKKKLQVNLNSGKVHCWVCDFKAHNIPQMLRKLNMSYSLIEEALKLTGEYKSFKKDEIETNDEIILPKHFKPLYIKQNDMVYKHALKYLCSRNIGLNEIIRYGIGYCEDGTYANRVIVPSYDKDGILNYFVARDAFPDSKYKYKNPSNSSKNIIPFELFINWNKDIVLVEGVFDAIAVKINAIPLLGKTPPKELIKKIVLQKPNMIYIALDKDAKKDAIKLSKLLMDYGIETCVVEMEGKDPSDIGFSQFWELTEHCETTKFSDLIRGRLYD